MQNYMFNVIVILLLLYLTCIFAQTNHTAEVGSIAKPHPKGNASLSPSLVPHCTFVSKRLW
jgi:hypothetical protein